MRSNDFDIKGSIIVHGLYLREDKNFYSCDQISKVCFVMDRYEKNNFWKL